MKKIVFIILCISISACSPKIKTSIYQERSEISFAGQIPIFTLGDELPDEAEILGKIQFRGNLDFGCTTAHLIEELSKKAKQSGANAIKIINYIPNNDLCPEVEAYLVYLDNSIIHQNKKYSLLEQPNQAVVHFYRRSVADLHTQFYKYKVHINNDAEIELRNRSKITLLVEPGFYIFQLEDESSQTIAKQLEAGQTYFIKVSVHNKPNTNATFTQPQMKLIDPLKGIIEFESFNNKRAKTFTYQNYLLYDQEKLVENQSLQDTINNRLTQNSQLNLNAYTTDFVAGTTANNTPDKRISETNFFADSEKEKSQNEYVETPSQEEGEANFFSQFFFAYNPIPFQFNEASINISPVGFPAIEQELESRKTTFGLDFGFIYGPEKTFFFSYFNYAQTTELERGRDKILGMNIGVGQRYFITPSDKHILSWGLGLGSESLRRELYNEDDFFVELAHTSYTLNPFLRYELMLPYSPVSIYIQTRYILRFGSIRNFTGVFYTEYIDGNRDDEEITRFGLNSRQLEFSDNSKSNFGNRLEISFGLNINI